MATQPAYTVNIQTYLSSYPLASAHNTLAVKIINTAPSFTIETCHVETSVYRGSLEWFQLDVDGVAMFFMNPEACFIVHIQYEQFLNLFRVPFWMATPAL